MSTTRGVSTVFSPAALIYLITVLSALVLVQVKATSNVVGPEYDLRVRPAGHGSGEKLHIRVTVWNRYIETINEKEGELVVGLVISVSWTDHRVRNVTEIDPQSSKYGRDFVSLPGEVKNEIWVPDLYVPNVRDMTPMTFQNSADSITIYADKTVVYDAYLRITFRCKMIYINYPMDKQSCLLEFMSYTMNTKDVMLHFSEVGVAGNVVVSTDNFLVYVLKVEHDVEEGGVAGVAVEYRLGRRLAYHLLHTYVPTIMMTIIGWLSLMVPLDYAYGRMVLSVTTLLVLVSLYVEVSNNSPEVNEIKATDVWVFTCIIFVFAAIIDCIVDLRMLSEVETEAYAQSRSNLKVGIGKSNSRPSASGENSNEDVVTGGGRKESYHTAKGDVSSHSSNDEESYHTTKDTGVESRYSLKPRGIISSTSGATGLTSASGRKKVVFSGDNAPFVTEADVSEEAEPSPTMLRWVRRVVVLEKSIVIIYPVLFLLFALAYWGYYLVSYNKSLVDEKESKNHTHDALGRAVARHGGSGSENVLYVIRGPPA